jgi:hypothetical protein
MPEKLARDNTLAYYENSKIADKKVLQHWPQIAAELKEIDLQMERAEHALNWNSEGLIVSFSES